MSQRLPSLPSSRWLLAALVLSVQAVVASPFGAAVEAGWAGTRSADSIEREFAVPCDWLRADLGAEWRGLLAPGGESRLGELAQAAGLPGLGGTLRGLVERWESVRLERRSADLAPLVARYPEWVFAAHAPLGGSHYAYTEALSDAQNERTFVPGAALCQLDLRSGRLDTLFDTIDGLIRDVDVSFDGQRVLYAYKASDRGDDFHLWELDTATGQRRQITSGPGVADYEGMYLPSGDLVFNSTRCQQIVDCWWTEVSNLYACRPDGTGLRRLTYDQVHDNYPTLLNDGRLIYTRWDYNDRGQIFPQGLFSAWPDGSGQSAFYGNNSWFPTTLIHARAIPGTNRLLAIATGHHSYQPGQLVRVDPAAGREENAGIQLLAPRRETPAERIDAYGQEGPIFAYPYPLSDDEFLVSYLPDGWRDGVHRGQEAGFGLYWMRADGRRELLARHPQWSVGRMVPLAPRDTPRQPPSRLNPARSDGSLYLQDIYLGPGLNGVPRGTIKSLRVVALEYRAAGLGQNSNHGPAGGAMSSTPPALGGGSWDVKRVLGQTPVEADGSAWFKVPARTPLYLQALDEQGQALATMRSWTTLMPGETQSCVGCHESVNTVPPNTGRSQALAAGERDLEPFFGPPRGFSFAREIQPILDAKCVSCHNDPAQPPPSQRGDDASQRPARPLMAAGGIWRYVTEEPAAGWNLPGFDDSHWPEGEGGFGSLYGTMRTAWSSPEIYLRRTVQLPPLAEAGRPAWRLLHDEDCRIWLNGREVLGVSGFNVDFDRFPLSAAGRAAWRPGANLLAVSVKQTAGSQLFNLALVDEQPRPAAVGVGGKTAFSLLDTPVADPLAKRWWSESYLALTAATQDPTSGSWSGHSTGLVNWLDIQAAPPVLSPAQRGAVTSELLTLLDDGHQGVRLSGEERAKLACWIDLLVPFCGDYAEAGDWSADERAWYQQWLDKRARLAALEER